MRSTCLVLLLLGALAPAEAQLCTTDARVRSIGTGTPGIGGTPRLAAVGVPVPGQPFSLRVVNAAADTPGAVYYGFAEASLSLPAFGATVHPAPLLLLAPFTTDSAGDAPGLAALVPVTPNLCGLEVVVQAVALDPTAMGGVAFTRGLGVRFGVPATRPPFEPMSYRAAIESPIARNRVVTGDLDGDGVPDALLVNDLGGDDVSVVLGRGDGSFGPRAEFFAGFGAARARLGDLDGDGDLDAVVAGWTFDDLATLLGAGDGTFFAPLPSPGTSSLHDVALGDFDGDGFLDAATSNLSSSVGAGVLLGNGVGGSSSATLFPAGQDGRAIEASDLDEDGWPDLVVANSISGELSVLPGLGAGSFGPRSVVPTGLYPHSLAVGDLDGDGLGDVAAGCRSSHAVAVHLGVGGGLLGAPTSYTTFEDPRTVGLGDLDGDVVLDLVATRSDSIVGAVAYRGLGDGTFVEPRLLASGYSVQGVTAADLDLDGDEDLLFAGFLDLVVHLDPLGPLRSHLIDAGGSQASAVGDLDRDGLVDVVSFDPDAAEVRTFLGAGDGSFVDLAPLPLGPNVVELRLVELTGDGLLDLVSVERSLNDVRVHPGIGDGTFAPATAYWVGWDPVAARLADVDGDGLDDLVVAGEQDDVVGVRPGLGGGAFGAPTFTSVGWMPLDIGVGDLDGDGLADLVVLPEDASAYLVLRATGGGAFSLPTVVLTGPDSTALLLEDLDADGELDVLVVHEAADQLSLHRGVGDATFAPRTTLFVGESPTTVTAADVTGDGDLDLLLGTTGPGLDLRLLAGNGDGTFGAAVRLPTNRALDARITALHAADLDLDGAPDLVLGGQEHGLTSHLGRLLE